MLYRTVKTDIWQDPWFVDLSPQAKCLFLYLVTNYSAKPGRYEIAKPRIAFETGLTKAELERAFLQLAPDIYFLNASNEVGMTEAKWSLVAGHYRLPRLIWAEIRAAVFRRDNFTCQYCGARGVRLECDHVVPLSRGGSNEDDNLTTACRACNRSKQAKLVEEWR